MKKHFLKALSILLATALIVGTMLPLGLTSVLAETDSSIIMNWGDFSQYTDSFTLEGAVESGNPGIAHETAMGKKWLAIKNVTNDWKFRGINESFAGDKTLTGTVDFSFTFKYGEATDSCMRFFIFADAAKPTTANLALKIAKGSIGLYKKTADSASNVDTNLIGNTLPFTTDGSPYRVRVIVDDSYISLSVTPLSTTDATTAIGDTQSFTVPKDPAINSFAGGIYGLTYHIGFRMTDTCVSLPSSMQQYSSYYKNWGDFTDTPDNYFTNGGANGVTIDKNTLEDGSNWLRIYGAGNTQAIIPQSFSEAKVLSDNFNWDFTFRAGPYAYHYANFYMLDENGTGENCYFIRIANGLSVGADTEKNVNNIQLLRRKTGEEDIVLGETYCAGITDSVPYRFNIAVTEETIDIKITKSSDPTDTYTITGTRDPEDNFTGGLYFGRYNGTVRLTDMQVYTNTVYYGKHWGDFSQYTDSFTLEGAVESGNPGIAHETAMGKKWLAIKNVTNDWKFRGINESFAGDKTLTGTVDFSFTFKYGEANDSCMRFFIFADAAKPTTANLALKIAKGSIGLYRNPAGSAFNADKELIGNTLPFTTDGSPYRVRVIVDDSYISLSVTPLSTTDATTAIGDTQSFTVPKDPAINSFAGGIYGLTYHIGFRLTDMQISSENALISHNHTYNTTELSSDYHSHFHCCECGAIKDIEAHTLAYKSTGIESCSACGYDAIVNVDTGDCNEDDYVDILDLVRMKKYEALLTTEINLHNADCDEDGIYNSGTDLAALRQILLGVKKKNRWITSEQLGLSSNPDFDCSDLVNDALAKEKNIYFNKGTYYFSKPIELNGMQLVGAGNTVSILDYTGTENSFITAKGDFLIEHINLRYDTSIDATSSVSGEKVILSLGTESEAATGTVKNVYFGNCGTAIYEAATSLPSHDLTIDTVTAMGFKHSGVQIKSSGRTDNAYENLYLCKGSTEQNTYSGFELNGSDSNTVIRQLNIEHFGAEYPVILNGCENLNAKTIHIEGTNLISDNTGYVNVSDTSGTINALTLAWTRVSGENCSVIRFGNAKTEGSSLTVGTLQARGINNPTESHGEWNRGIDVLNNFSFLSRSSGANKYTCTIDNYVYYTTLSDADIYESFACDDNLIDITKKGNIATHGTTSERPTHRLCANFSTYFDTDLGQLLTWNGSEWVA